MEELERRKEILKVVHCFKGPIHRAFVYVYYQLYTQETDVHKYVINTEKDSQFLPKELEVLKNEKRPAYLSFFLLYKVCPVSFLIRSKFILKQLSHFISNHYPTRGSAITGSLG